MANQINYSCEGTQEIIDTQEENRMDFKWKENGRIKLAIGLGTRPEIIRLAAVITAGRCGRPPAAS